MMKKSGGGGECDGGSGSGGGGTASGDPDAPASPDLFLARLPLAEAQRLLELAGSGDSPILLGVEAEAGADVGAEGAGGGRGRAEGAPLFAVALPRGPEGDAAAAAAVEGAARAAAASEGPCPPSFAFAFVAVRSEGPRAPPRAAAAAALAVGLSAFHSGARFDAGSGLATRMASAGHARDEVAAGAAEGAERGAGAAERGEAGGGGGAGSRRRPGRSRPRVDPAVLVLAPCRDFVLLGRKASWPPRRYSLLAGFAELGETLEQAAERELA